jgi:hypothetical protein
LTRRDGRQYPGTRRKRRASIPQTRDAQAVAQALSDALVTVRRAKAEVDNEFATSVARQADIDAQRIAARPAEFDHERATEELSPAEREAQDQALRRQQERAEQLWGVKFDDQMFSAAVQSLNAESLNAQWAIDTRNAAIAGMVTTKASVVSALDTAEDALQSALQFQLDLEASTNVFRPWQQIPAWVLGGCGVFLGLYLGLRGRTWDSTLAYAVAAIMILVATFWSFRSKGTLAFGRGRHKERPNGDDVQRLSDKRPEQ